MNNIKTVLAEISDSEKRDFWEMPVYLAKDYDGASLLNLLTDFYFVDAKVSEMGLQPLIEDYDLIFTPDIPIAENQKNSLKLIQEALRLSTNAVEHDRNQLASQMLARLRDYSTPEILTFLEKAEKETKLLPLTSSLAAPGGTLKRILEAKNCTVRQPKIKITSDGLRAISLYDEIKVWNLETGKILHTLSLDETFDSKIIDFAILPNERQVIYVLRNGDIVFWEIDTGKIIQKLESTISNVISLAVSDDGHIIVINSSDSIFEVRNLITKEILYTLKGKIELFLINNTTENYQIISAYLDGNIKVIDVEKKEGIVFKCVSRLAELDSADFYQSLLELNEEHHSDDISAIKLTPDGHKIITASDDGTLKIWNLQDGKLIKTLQHSQRNRDDNPAVVGSVSVTSDGRIVSGCWDGTIKVWNLETGALLKTLKHSPDQVRSLSVTPNGHWAISGDRQGTIKIWDLSTISKTSRQQLISTSTNGIITVRDLQTGATIKTIKAHDEGIQSLAVTPNGHWAISDSWDKTLKLWDLQTGSLLNTLSNHSDWSNVMTITPNGKWVLIGMWNGTIEVWHIGTGINLGQLGSIGGHKGHVRTIAMTSDSKKAVSAGDDGNIKVWDISSLEHWSLPLDKLKPIATFEGHKDKINFLTITPDDKKLISASADSTLKIWDLQLKELEKFKNISKKFDKAYGNLSFDELINQSDNADDDESELLEYAFFARMIASGMMPFPNSPLHTINNYLNGINTVVITPNGEQVIFTSIDKTIKFLDLQAGEIIYTLDQLTDSVNTLSVTLDGKQLIVTSDKTFTVWDIATKSLLSSFEEDSGLIEKTVVTELPFSNKHFDSVTAIEILPDEKQAISASRDGTLKIWDLQTGKALHTLSGHIDWISEQDRVAAVVRGKPIGRPDLFLGDLGDRLSKVVQTIAVGLNKCVSASDKAIKVWDLKKGEVLQVLKGHKEIDSIIMTSDEKKAISISHKKGTFRVWDLEQGTFRSPEEDGILRRNIVVSAGGEKIISLPNNHTVEIWDLNKGSIRNTKRFETDIQGALITPDGRKLITLFDSGILVVYDTDNNTVLDFKDLNSLLNLELLKLRTVTSDGQFIVFTSIDSILLYPLENNLKSIKFDFKTSLVDFIISIPNSSILGCTSIDGIFKIWDLSTETLVDTFYGDSQFTACKVASSGKTIVLGDASGQVHFLNMK